MHIGKNVSSVLVTAMSPPPPPSACLLEIGQLWKGPLAWWETLAKASNTRRGVVAPAGVEPPDAGDPRQLSPGAGPGGLFPAGIITLVETDSRRWGKIGWNWSGNLGFYFFLWKRAGVGEKNVRRLNSFDRFGFDWDALNVLMHSFQKADNTLRSFSNYFISYTRNYLQYNIALGWLPGRGGMGVGGIVFDKEA